MSNVTLETRPSQIRKELQIESDATCYRGLDERHIKHNKQYEDVIEGCDELLAEAGYA